MEDIEAAFAAGLCSPPVHLASKRTGQVEFVVPPECMGTGLPDLYAALSRTRSKCIETYYVVLASGQLSAAKATAKELGLQLEALELLQVRGAVEAKLTPGKLEAMCELWKQFHPTR